MSGTDTGEQSEERLILDGDLAALPPAAEEPTMLKPPAAGKEPGSVRRQLLRVAPLVLVLLLAAAHIGYLYRVTRGWVVDDAYISFRYVENWVSGHGLVFNPGERVEGYSNLLWMLLLAPFAKLGLPIDRVAQVLGVALTLCSVALMVGIGSALMSRRVGLALGALYAANHALMSWAFGGLELPLFLALFLSGTYLLFVRQSPWALCVFAAAALTRPDGLLFLLIGLPFVLWPSGPTQGKRWRLVAVLCAVGIVAAQVVGRIFYYGELLPNTFYAKVGFHAGQLGRGYEYVFAAARFYVVLLPAAALLPFSGAPRAWRSYALASLVGYGAFVLYSGGDPHPGFRIALPLVPMAWLCLGTLLAEGAKHSRVGALVLWGALFVNDVAQGVPGLPKGSAYEHFRTDKVSECGKKIGRWLDEHAPPNALIATNTGGSIPYFSRRRSVDMLGLTDATIARANRGVGKGYVGHEAHDSSYVLSLAPDYIILCFSCNTSGPCLASDKELVADKRFAEGYKRHSAKLQKLKFYYYTPRAKRADAGTKDEATQESDKAEGEK